MITERILVVSGYYCNGTTESPAPCPVGHYCLEGTSTPNQYPCKPGTYNNLTQQSSEAACVSCPAGWYCEGYARVEPNGECAEGFYCSGGSWSRKPGDIGSANYDNATSPSDTCYRNFECVCPAWNKTTGRIVSNRKIFAIVKSMHVCMRAEFIIIK